jgi:CRP/FNR family transcriptional regulator
MNNYNEISDKRLNNIKVLYKSYPILRKISDKNREIIDLHAVFKTLYADEYIKSESDTCNGVMFVIKGKIKIQKVNDEGEETNLYNIGQGEFCHEALSCLSNFKSLNITGKAIQDSEVCIIPFEVVKLYFMKNEDFLLYIYEDLYKKFNTIIDNKEEIMHEALETRLVKLLINKNSKIIYSTHSEIAFEIDSSREVISRKLKSIEKLGYIRLERGKIIVLKELKELLNS